MAYSEDTRDRILEKVEFVSEAVDLLSSKQALERSEYLEDPEEQAIVERKFQTAIEACIDIVELLIVDSSEPMPTTNADKFLLLGEQGVVSSRTAEKMAEAAGFRNVIAHQYGHEIDDDLVYRHLQNDLEWFPTFCREIDSHLNG